MTGRTRPRVAGDPVSGAAATRTPARPVAGWRRPGWAHAPKLTGRRMMVAAMALFLVVVLASPFQTYLSRRASVAASERQQQQLNAQLAELKHQSEQWQDPAFVARQARIRLQYIRPGDTLYTVLDAHGNPIEPPAPAADGEGPRGRPPAQLELGAVDQRARHRHRAVTADAGGDAASGERRRRRDRPVAAGPAAPGDPGGGAPVPVRQPRRGRDRVPAARRHSLPDAVLPDLPEGGRRGCRRWRRPG